MPARPADVALAAFAVVVLAGAWVAVTDDGPAPQAAALSAAVGPTPRAGAVPTASPVPTAAPTASPGPDGSPDGPAADAPVVLTGPGLELLARPLGTALGRPVTTATTADLAGVTIPPAAVVIAIDAGSQTTTRTRAAVTAVQRRFPGVPVLVVGPFSSDDRKSAASVRAAAAALKVTFLDPVESGWRAADTSPTLTAADVPSVVRALATGVTAAVPG